LVTPIDIRTTDQQKQIIIEFIEDLNGTPTEVCQTNPLLIYIFLFL